MSATKKQVPGKKRQNSRQSRAPLSSLTRGIPNALVAKLHYMSPVALNPAAGAFSTYVFRANSCFDPDYTGTGHQPLGFDQLSPMYAHYTVLSSKIRVTSCFPSSTIPAIVGIHLNSDYALTGPWYTASEQAASKYTVVQSTNFTQPVVRHSYSAKSFFGVKDPQDAKSTIGAAVGANPSEGVYFILYVQAVDLSADIANIDFVVDMSFTVQFSEREELGGS